MSNIKKINFTLKIFILICLNVIFFSSNFANSFQVWEQKFEHSKLTIKHNDTTPNILDVTLDLEKGWFAYAPHAENKDKILQASIQSDHNHKTTIIWPKNLIVTNNAFSKNIVFQQLKLKIKINDVKNINSSNLSGNLRWVICKEVCIPQQANFQLSETSNKSKKSLLLTMIISAFLGGLILNIMPCVLPIISLKLLHIQTLSGKSYKQALTQNIIYSAGILTSMLVLLFCIILLKISGIAIGWGFQLQNPYFIYIMFVFITAIGLQLSGFISLPAWLYQLQSKAATLQQKHRGHFIQGCLAVLLASPCSAPFMGSAISFALSQPIYIASIIMTSLALGFAFPFLILSLLPGWIKYLPKPGIWMTKVEKLLSLPLFATSIWLGYLLYDHISKIGFLIILIASFFVLVMIFMKIKYRKIVWLTVIMIFVNLTIVQMNPQKNINQEKLIKQIYSLQNNNKAVFVNVTADWCVTCKTNERLVLKTKEINNLFAKYNVQTITLDWTKHSPEITNYLKQFGLSSVPSYIFYPPGKKHYVLSPQLSKQNLKNIIKKHTNPSASK